MASALFRAVYIVWATGLAAAPLPPAEQILDKFVEVTGGQAAYEKISTQYATAAIEFSGKNIAGKLTLYQAAKSRSYVLMELPGVGQFEQGTAEGVAWERSAMLGPRLKTGPERAAALREADVQSRVLWRNHFAKAETAGEEEIDGRRCYKIVLTPNEGEAETRFFEVSTGLLVRIDRIVRSQMGEVPAQTILGDYRPVGGILTAHSLRQKTMGQDFVTTIQTIEYNADIPDSRFALPEDVRALAAAPKP